MGIKQKLETLEKEIAPKLELKLWYITNVPLDEDGPSQRDDPCNVESSPGCGLLLRAVAHSHRRRSASSERSTKPSMRRE
jgi:hypothetical protein